MLKVIELKSYLDNFGIKKMGKKAFLIILLVFTFILSGYSVRTKLIIPKAIWVKIFFGSINKATDEAKLRRLRKLYYRGTNFEIRVWLGFGTSLLRGYVIKRVNHKWSGLFIIESFGDDDGVMKEVYPKRSWNHLWQSLLREDILTLPDSSSFREKSEVWDGESYVVEINRKGIYRCYKYGNPDMTHWPEARKMENIIEILIRELGYE